MTTVREVTLDLLRSFGMTTIFGNPGSTEETFLHAFPGDFRYVLALQEAAVVGIADGYAQATGEAAFVNLHTAPGVGHAMGALVTAWHARTPLVVTAGQQVRAMMTLEPWLINRDAVELPKPYVKWSYEPPRAADVPAAIERAYHTAMQPPTGPVFVSIPMDDWSAPATPHQVRTVSYRVAPDPAALDQVVARLRSARRPLLVAGAGIDRRGAWETAIALAERLQAPVWMAPAAERGGFPQDHPLFQGMLPLAMAPLAERLAGHDVVLVCGAPVFRYYPYLPGPIVPEGTTLFQFTDDPDEAARAPAGTAIVGDIALALERLLAEVPATEREVPARRPPAAPPSPRPGEPMPPVVAMQALAKALPVNAVIVEEAASNRAAFYDQVRINQPGGYFATASGGLGFAVPAAVGVQLARPDRQVACVVGDGAAIFALPALWTAAQHHLPIVYLVLRNGHYGILKSFAAFHGLSEQIPGLDLPGLDLVSLAHGFGCVGRRVDQASEIEGALRTAFSEARRDGTPILIEVVVDATMPSLVPGHQAELATGRI